MEYIKHIQSHEVCEVSFVVNVHAAVEFGSGLKFVYGPSFVSLYQYLAML